MERFLRTEALLGSDKMNKLRSCRVIVFGVGGVGGYATEALARSGVGEITLVDPDTVSVTNINRQIIALDDTVGRKKVEVMRERILKINPDAKVKTFDVFYSPDNADEIDLSRYDYIVDAIDSVPSKIEMITRAKDLKVPIISSMGFGNKLDPLKVELEDISKTSVCPLARVMRKKLKDHGIYHLKTVYSRELPTVPDNPIEDSGKRLVASVAFVPSVAGLVIASEVIRDLII